MLASLTPFLTDFTYRLRSRGVTLRADGSNLLVSPRSRLTDNDRATIRERKGELLVWLTTAADPLCAEPSPPVSIPSQSKLTRPVELDWLARFHREPAPWNTEDMDLIRWFVSRRDALPCQPFTLFGFAKVSDPQKLYAALERDIQAGSNGPRATGLRHELRQLRVLC